ncbi:MAG TPA: hypothetical protein VNQ81_03135 [Povalibacter sp.]|nr:hypothetical protein [Povalibacter sp.]
MARFTLGLAAAGLLVVAGCGSVKLVATSNIPTPLVVKIPVSVALFIPKDFSEFVYQEERSGTDWNISLGKAQSDGLTLLLTSMFDRVVMVDGVNAGTQAGSDIRAILEPSVEEYAFVTPRDAGSPFFAVSIKYRVNVYTPDGRLADSWGFTGYGTAPSQGISSSAPLTEATALALRDAGAKLAVEFRDQAIVRGLIPESAPLVPMTSQPIPGTATPSSQDSTPGAQPAPANAPASGGSAPTGQPTPAEAGDPSTDQPASPTEQSVPPAGQESLPPPPENATGAPAEEKAQEPVTAPPPVKKEPDPVQPETLAGG